MLEIKSSRPNINRTRQRPPFERIALLLQGGGALGSYQAGVYEALAEANLPPDSGAGISIGAVNAGLLAGNPPEKRAEKLREFWEAVSSPSLAIFGARYHPEVEIKDELTHRVVNQTRGWGIMLFGAPDFFKLRLPPPYIWPARGPDELSYDDGTPLRATLERLLDFDRIKAGSMRFSVGAVNVRVGNFGCFDTTTHRIGSAHVRASRSLPAGFPAITSSPPSKTWRRPRCSLHRSIRTR